MIAKMARTPFTKAIALLCGSLVVHTILTQLRRGAFSDKRKVEVDVLTKDYDHRFTEIMFHSARYHRQTHLLQLYVTIIGVIAGLFWGDRLALIRYFSHGSMSESIFLILFLIMAAIIMFYLYANLLDALYAIYMSSVRSHSIEERLNTITKHKSLIWDSKIIPELHSIGFIGKGTWVKPNVLVGIWSFLLFLGLTAVLIVLCYVLTPSILWIYAPLVLTLVLFHIHQWINLTTTGVKVLRDIILSPNDLPIQSIRSTSTHLISDESKHNYYLIFCLTLLLGYTPMLIYSLMNDSFWVTSPYDFPFACITSILIGDLFLLPWINIQFYKLWKHARTVEWRFHRKYARWILGASLVSSLIINAITHYIWSRDPYTGFMDISHGELTAAGWWHMIFSTVEMSIIFNILILTIRAYIIDPDYKMFMRGYKSILIIFVFTLLSIVDFVIRNTFILSKSFKQALATDWLSLLTIPVVLLILLLLTFGNMRLKRKIVSKQQHGNRCRQ